MRWIKTTKDEAAAARLARELGLHPVAAGILTGRGIVTPEDAGRFLTTQLSDLPDPHLMRGMSQAVERLSRALRQNERIVVYGDYDVDGVTSTTLLVRFLRELGADAGYYVPHRLNEGYGLNPQAVDQLAAEGAKLIVTVDCGVTAVEEVERATRAGVDVVVVDHHKVPADLPRAVAVLNPHQPDCAFPTKELCAEGVTFFLLMALRRRLREEGRFERRPEPNLREYLDLVALGTVADVVPLVNANRVLVAHGLRELERGARLGVATLKRVAGVGPGPVTAGQVGFKLGPRINAAGRLADAGAAVELLLCDDPARAHVLAESLERANEERRALERAISDEAMAQAAPRAERVRGLVLHGEGWHPGVVGIVASRVVERFHRPTVVIGVEGEGGKGSCRSMGKFDMFEALERCASHLVRFGGHRHAAGVQIEKARIEAFTRAFEKEAVRQLAPEDLVPSMRIDAEIATDDATLDLAQALERLGPFGAGNPEPVLCARMSGGEGRVLPAKTGGPDHLKFRVGATDAIAFGLGDSRQLLRGRVDVAFQLSVDEWQGRVRAQARVKAIESA